MNKKYLLFDLDGTLTDPKIGICTCVQYALSSFGIEEPDLDKLEPFIGPPLKDSFMKYYNFDDARAEEAIEKVEGIRCGAKPTSCPDQLAKALRLALEEDGKR